MKPRLKKFLNFLLIFGTLLIVLLVGFNGADPEAIWNAFTQSLPQWILACFGCYAVYMLCDAVCIWYYLRNQGYRISLSYALFVSVEGLYYCGITPGASGGQPMQIFFLNKKKVPIGISTSALVVKQFCFQSVMLVLDIVLLICYSDFVNTTLGGNSWILIMGFGYNALVVAALVLMAVNKRLVHGLVMGCIRIGTRLRICKDPEASRTKWEDVVETYHSSVQVLIRRPMQLIFQFLVSLLQLLALLVTTHCVFYALHVQNLNFGQVLTLAAVLYTSANYTPLPGASGAQEGFYFLFFAPVLGMEIRLPSLLLWRFFTYYLWLIVGAVVTVAHGFRKDQSKKESVLS